MKLHYYESILNFYCDSLTEEELLEKIREWTLRYLWYRKKREEDVYLPFLKNIKW